MQQLGVQKRHSSIQVPECPEPGVAGCVDSHSAERRITWRCEKHADYPLVKCQGQTLRYLSLVTWNLPILEKGGVSCMLNVSQDFILQIVSIIALFVMRVNSIHNYYEL